MAKSKQLQITEEELSELRQVRKANADLRNELAEIGLLKINIAEREAAASRFSGELRTADRKLGETLREKYGEIEIDLETGNYTTVEK